MEAFDASFHDGARDVVLSNDPATKYLRQIRVREALARLIALRGEDAGLGSLLVVCGGEGQEASIAADMGFDPVVTSDISARSVSAAEGRDARLRAIQANAEATGLDDDSFDVVLVQDGLHHLQEPVRGFCEMLRIARSAVVMIEPRISLASRLLGIEWEEQGEGAVNYVFRWRLGLVHDVASSYLGRDGFEDHSYAFWHHNPVLTKLAHRLGSGEAAARRIARLRSTSSRLLGRFGNQMCGLILLEERPAD